MKKIYTSILLCLILFNSEKAFADIYDDAAKSNRDAFISRACNAGSEMYAGYAKWISDNLETIYRNSKPNTSQRDKLYRDFMKSNQDYEDKDYLQNKEFVRSFDATYERKELLSMLLLNTRKMAFNIAAANTGLSKIQYQSKIEIECKTSLIK